MTASGSDAPAPNAVTGAVRRGRFRAILPHLLTALLAVGLSIAFQWAFLASRPPPAAMFATVAPPPPPVPAPTVAPSPTSASPPLAESISRQELADLRAEVDRLWTVVYLSRAINQVADAETALRTNDRQSVDQSLIAMDDSLALAYARADVPGKDPIYELRRQIGDIRDDLYLRPEGMDTRFARLRQNMLALVEARQE